MVKKIEPPEQRHGRATKLVYIAAVAAICATLVATTAARAADVGLGDLRAAMRSLGFLDSLQNHSTISIGVVYAGDNRDGRDQAQRVAGMLASISGPDTSTIQASTITAEDLVKSARRFDALYLMPGTAANGSLITDFIKRQHMVSISSDPACLDGRYCVLMVQGGSGVNIVLDTALAAAVGAHFSSVFTMIVKRR